MANSVIVGAQWGDEGKAKVIDYLTERSDFVSRFQGGANAGHTVIVDGTKFVFHMVPSGIMYSDKKCIVGNGVVFDAEQFFREVDDLAEKGISVEGRLFVSDIAHLAMPYHKSQDQASECAMGVGKIGTTGRGIGPAYSDKVSRCGIRTGDLRNWDLFSIKVRDILAQKKALVESLLKQPFTLTADEILDRFSTIRTRLLPMLADTSLMLFEASRAGKRLLFEGAQGTFLDIDHGTYPFVTSSNCVSGAVCTGVGVGPSVIDEVVGIVKAYTTRVGNGPFPTELNDADGELLRKVGKEFGATTGRPRRCGWFDSVMLRKAVRLNGMTRLALTKVDVLNDFDAIKICTAYMIDGVRTEEFPSDASVLERVTPIYETMPGWKCGLADAKTFDDLPEAARKYIRRLQELCYGVRLLIVSTGPERHQTIEVDPIN